MIYEISKAWHEVRAFILPALAYHATHTEDDVLIRLMTGEYKLWRGEGCAAITCLVQYPRFKALEVRWGGGDLDGLEALRPLIETWARAQGCAEVVSTGRDGWGRVFPDYAKCGAIYFKEV